MAVLNKNLDRLIYVCHMPSMTRGPDKQFDPDAVLEKAMQVFWAKGYAATGLAELQARMGIGRKSLYDTFGNKRQLFIKALQLYSDSVVGQISAELDKKGSPLGNVRRLMRSLEEDHSLPESMGCLLGVSMAQCPSDDGEMAGILRHHIQRVEEAFYRAFKRARDIGELNRSTNTRDLARLFMGIAQGLALVGRVQDAPSVPRSIVNAALATLKSA
ncbi:MAG: TetR/AcrR family transcriptional regulator [Proteobacteria bacterium]|nr:TetR/AcrR family transcriptional regulator [Pseudomonadota bacterium]